MVMREIVGLGVAFVFLAGFSIAIVNGGNTAQVFTSLADGFANVTKAATLQKQ